MLNIALLIPTLSIGMLGQTAPIKYGAAFAKRDPAEFQQALSKRILDATANISPTLTADSNLDDQLALWELINRVGPEAISDVKSRPQGKGFFTWLGDHPRVIEDYLTSGQSEEYTKSGLEIWYDIWVKDPDSHDGLWLRAAIATSLVNAIPVMHFADNKPEDPLVRYFYVKSSHEKGALLPYFDKAPIWELRHVIGSWALESDMDWIRTAIKDDLKTQAKVGNACNMVPYRLKSLKGVSIFDGAPYYDNKPMTMPILVEYGGVCGAIAKFGTQTCQAYGIPAMPVTQPGHCAFIWKNTENTWVLGNDIFGWSQSGEHPGTRILWGAEPTYVWLLSDAFADKSKLLDSDRFLWLSDLFKGSDSDKYQAALQAANGMLAINLPVAERLIATAATTEPVAEVTKTEQAVSAAFENYPFALESLAASVCPKMLVDYVTDPGTKKFVDATLTEFAAGDTKLQHNSAAWARAKFLDVALKTLTKSNKDFFTPIQSGKDYELLYSKLSADQQPTFIRVLEASIKTALARKDLYEVPLTIYSGLALNDESVRARALAVLGGQADIAKAQHLVAAHRDLCAKLVSLSEAAHDNSAAERWKTELSAAL